MYELPRFAHLREEHPHPLPSTPLEHVLCVHAGVTIVTIYYIYLIYSFVSGVAHSLYIRSGLPIFHGAHILKKKNSELGDIYIYIYSILLNFDWSNSSQRFEFFPGTYRIDDGTVQSVMNLYTRICTSDCIVWRWSWISSKLIIDLGGIKMRQIMHTQTVCLASLSNEWWYGDVPQIWVAFSAIISMISMTPYFHPFG